jgi:hypothetical protein
MVFVIVPFTIVLPSVVDIPGTFCIPYFVCMEQQPSALGIIFVEQLGLFNAAIVVFATTRIY